MKRSNYRNIKEFGQNMNSLEVDNPLSYCLNWTIDQQFNHGGNSYIYGQYSKPCQSYFSDYCAEKWDGFCEVASKNTNISFPNNIEDNCQQLSRMTAGDLLIRNTAAKKYLIEMSGDCVQRFEPFDPTVANSPMISYWGPSVCGGVCIPTYAVIPEGIDNDIVMNKILDNPVIAIDILLNIYETMKKNGTIDKLVGTKLGRFYQAYFEKMNKA